MTKPCPFYTRIREAEDAFAAAQEVRRGEHLYQLWVAGKVHAVFAQVPPPSSAGLMTLEQLEAVRAEVRAARQTDATPTAGDTHP